MGFLLVRADVGKPRPCHFLILMIAGIIMYTAIGGLKATFMSSYIHTVYIYVVLCIFS